MRILYRIMIDNVIRTPIIYILQVGYAHLHHLFQASEDTSLYFIRTANGQSYTVGWS